MDQDLNWKNKWCLNRKKSNTCDRKTEEERKSKVRQIDNKRKFDWKKDQRGRNTQKGQIKLKESGEKERRKTLPLVLLKTVG